jgi:simple sugar transport system permease protein
MMPPVLFATAVGRLELLDFDFWVGVLAGGVRLAVPLGLAALGELIGERAGVLNLGVEGTMALGALAGVVAGAAAGAWIGLATGLVVGAVVGLIFGLLVIRVGANEVVTGFGLVLGGGGLAIFIHNGFFETTPRLSPPSALDIPGLGDIPGIGPILINQPPVVWLFPIAVIITALVFRYTKAGLQIRAAGDGPDAARARGVDVNRTRIRALVAAGALTGLGGAVLTAGTVGQFSDFVVGGRGFVALALVIVARWKPVWLLASALLIGAAQAFQLFAQAQAGLNLSVDLLQALPFLLTLAVLAVRPGGADAPPSLGRLGLESTTSDGSPRRQWRSLKVAAKQAQ